MFPIVTLVPDPPSVNVLALGAAVTPILTVEEALPPIEIVGGDVIDKVLPVPPTLIVFVNVELITPTLRVLILAEPPMDTVGAEVHMLHVPDKEEVAKEQVCARQS